MIQAERWLAFARAAAARGFAAWLRAIAARINALNAVARIVSPSCRSMARRVQNSGEANVNAMLYYFFSSTLVPSASDFCRLALPLSPRLLKGTKR